MLYLVGKPITINIQFTDDRGNELTSGSFPFDKSDQSPKEMAVNMMMMLDGELAKYFEKDKKKIK